MERIFVWGLNFKTAPIEYREILACNKSETTYLLQVLKTITGVKEIMLLSTCNRVELYTVAGHYDVVNELVDNLMEIKGVNPDVRRYSFLLEGKEALSHIFQVVSSLDSMVIGETQITSQFKEAFRIAKETGTTGKIINRLYEKALRTAKRVRTETGISKNAVSVSYVAVELARKIFGGLKKTKVLLIGAGEMGELCARYLKKLQASLFITNRTYEKAVELAQELEGHTLRFESLEDYLHEFEIVILSTSSKEPILNKQMVKRAIKVRDYKPMFIIDISVPRNADPSINHLDEVFLYNIDDLKSVADKNLSERLKEKEKGQIIVWDEVEKFVKWLEVLHVERYIIKIKETWGEVELREPKVRKLIHFVIEEIRKQPSLAERLFKIFVQEVDNGDALRRLSCVHNRANGT